MTFRLVGPRTRVLRQVTKRELHGTLSPSARVTISGISATQIGIPKGAHSFAFSYPLPLSEGEAEALIATAVRVAGREDHHKTRSRKATTDTANNASASPAWLDFVLVGGFVYFDKSGQFLQANALSYQSNKEPTSSEVFAEGPQEAASQVGQIMVSAGRMDPVTLPALQAIGFQSFGWVNPAEEFGTHAPLGCDYGQSAAQSHGAGAFLYGSDNGSFFYYALSAATSQDPVAAERRKSILVSGAGLALDNALRGSIIKLRESVNRAQDMVSELLKEEERSMRVTALHCRTRRAAREHPHPHPASLMCPQNILRLRLVSPLTTCCACLVASPSAWTLCVDSLRGLIRLAIPVRAMAEHVALSEAERREARDPRRRWRMQMWSRAMLFVPAVFSLVVAAALLTVAYAAHLRIHFPVYRIVASLVWFSAFTHLTWRVLADCATEGLSAKQIRRRRRLLPLIPLSAAAVEALLLVPSWLNFDFPIGPSGMAIADFADVGALGTAYTLLFVVLPASIYVPRRAAAEAAVRALDTEHAGIAAGRADRAMATRQGEGDTADGIRAGATGAGATGAGATGAGGAIPARVPGRGQARRRGGSKPSATSAAAGGKPSPSGGGGGGPLSSCKSLLSGMQTSRILGSGRFQAEPPEGGAPDARPTIGGPVSVAMTPPSFMGPPSNAPIGVLSKPPPDLPDPQALARAMGRLKAAQTRIVPPESMLPPTRAPTDRGVAGVDARNWHLAPPTPTPLPERRVRMLADLRGDASASGAVAAGQPRRATHGTSKKLTFAEGPAPPMAQPLPQPSSKGALLSAAAEADQPEGLPPPPAPPMKQQEQPPAEVAGAAAQTGEVDAYVEAEMETDVAAERKKAAASNLHAGLAAGGGEAWRGAAAAALRIQTRVRNRGAQQQFRRIVLKRHQDRCALSLPILVAAAVELVGSLVIDTLDQLDWLPEWLVYTGWLLLLLPSIVVILRDLNYSVDAPARITFSISHAVYFVACLYRVSYRAAAFSIGCQKFFSTFLANDPTLAALLSQLLHQICFTSIHLLAKLTLQLVGIQNAFAHLLFPFHFFDVASNYAFFAIRDTFRDGFTTAWGASTALLQLHIIMRNSGTWDGVFNIVMVKLKLYEETQTGPSDVLFMLQFFARVAIQYDLADITAMVTVPSLVSFFVWRDGWFVLEGTGVEVRSCDLVNMWGHFAVLLVIKPVAFWMARRILERKMALTLLGRETVHGRSSIAKERTGQLFHRLLHQASARNLVSGIKSLTDIKSARDMLGGAKDMLASTKNLLAYGSVRGAPGVNSPSITPSHSRQFGVPASADDALADGLPGASRSAGMRRVSSKVQLKDKAVLDAAFDQYGFSEERKSIIAKDFAVSHLSYAHLFHKIMRRSTHFFAVVVLFQLFACLPRHALRRGANRPLALGQEAVPFRAAWVYVNSSALDPEAFFNPLVSHENDTRCAIGPGWNSFFVDMIGIVPVQARPQPAMSADGSGATTQGNTIAFLITFAMIFGMLLCQYVTCVAYWRWKKGRAPKYG
jgi:hypothetical protein